MAKRMLIDATHPEETRVVVHNGSRLEEFDYETVSKKQLKGNIYLAKITRVEPSLQAAFVEYGGNRHGFLPFSEIHPDYYRIPIADREALLAEEKALKSSVRSDDDADENPADSSATEDQAAEGESENAETEAQTAEAGEAPESEAIAAEAAEAEASDAENGETAASDEDPAIEQDDTVEEIEGETSVDTLSEDDDDEVVQRSRAKLLRKYKIQEVIKRRQVILVQVSKEERGNKGAALTTYLSLAGRYCVLMPNTNKGGGISRKISNAGDRRRLKEILGELKIPEGIAVIVRTAGSQRNKTEIRRDYEYLMRLWNEIRELTLRSSAPALIHEEANLIKRAIRDLYSRDMEDVLVEGENSYKAAKSFMRTLMPSHAKKVQLYKDPAIPLFHRYKVESQLDAIHNPTVQLKSGGYIVINPTEALVAVDVNSGKATRERHIEETALKTNVEAADEVARQVRLRDLAGLVVIDFIDMEESRHNREVERRLKEAMKNDRARIQLGRISPFGLLEMSRQRLRPSLVENSTLICPTCQGVGTVRTTESTALHVLRAVEEEGIRRAGGSLLIKVPTAVALYMLNQKRALLIDIEERYGFEIEISADNTLTAPDYTLERVGEQGERSNDNRSERSSERAPERSRDRGRDRQSSKQREEEEDLQTETSDSSDESGGERKRSRRRRRRKRDDETSASPAEENAVVEDSEDNADAAEDTVNGESGESDDEEAKARKRRRRGKRGGRRRSRRKENEDGETLENENTTEESADQEDAIAAAGDSGGDTAAVPLEVASAEAVSSGETETSETAAPEAVTPVSETESPASEAGEASAENADDAPAEPAEEAPKPKRRRSRAKKSTDDDKAAKEKSAEKVSAEEAPASETTPEEEPKAEPAPKKRASRSRATTTKTPRTRTRKPAAAKAKADAVSEDSVVADTRVTEPAELVAQESSTHEPASAQTAPAAISEPEQPSSAEQGGENAPDGENGEKRRGWWSRWV